MGYPSPVESVVRLPDLVFPDLGEGDFVRGRILAARDECRHAADRVRAPSVARADEQVGIRPHERNGHRDLRPIGQDELLASAELLDDAEDVVPSACVQARCVVPQFVQDLLHLKRGGDRLDQGGRLHASREDPDPFLGEAENVGPQAGLEMTLHLREVEVGARPPGEKLLRVVEEVQPEIHEAPRSDLAVDAQMFLGEMPPAGPHDQGRGLGVQSVLLPLRAAEFERAPDGPNEVQLALDDVSPGGRVRVLEVRHEHARPGVEGVDHHLAIRRPGDLDPPVLQIRGDRGNAPGALPYGARVRKEVQSPAAIERLLSPSPLSQEIPPSTVEPSMQSREEPERLRREQRLILLGDGSSDLDPLDRRLVHPAVAQSRRSRSEGISFAYRTGGRSLPPEGSTRPAIAGPTSLASTAIHGPCRTWSQNLLPSREMSRRRMESRGARP